ncbi:hypothetical protein HY612_05460 [Candidatus Roizmanbacteria bacterium]|nr:hypothetical protein [Candidatus Roizmanbacteria bacterium]
MATLSILLYKSRIPNPKNQTNDQNTNDRKTSPKIPSLIKEGKKGWLELLDLKNWNLKFIWDLGFGHWDFILICLILFFSFFIHPSAGLLFLFSWVIFHGIKFIHHPSSTLHLLPKIILQTIFLFCVVLIPLLYFQVVTSSYPWKSLVDFDKYNRYPVNVKDYILALGPIFFTGSFGLILALIKKEQKYLSLVSWVLGAFVAIYVFKKFPYQSELRFVQTANHVPLAILSVYFISQLIMKIKNFFLTGGADPEVDQRSLQDKVEGQKSEDTSFEHFKEPMSLEGSSSMRERRYRAFLFENSRRNLTKLKKWIEFLILFIMAGPIILLGIVQSYFSIKAQTDFIHQRAVAVQPLVPYPSQVMYPLKDFWDALMWLEKNTSRNSVVLSQVTAGNYIPAYSGNFVYLGHNPETPFFDQRTNNVNQFFSGTMIEQDALNFLKKENISYIFYGPQEKEKSTEDIIKYLFLNLVFTSPYVTIYKVE